MFLISIEKVKRYSKVIATESELIKEDFLFDGIMRELEILGEALKHVVKHPELKNETNEKWKEIIGFRNIIVHDYFGIDLEIILKIVTTDIFEFEKEFLKFIHRIQDKCNLKEAINNAKTDIKKTGNKSTLNYLIGIEEKLKKQEN